MSPKICFVALDMDGTLFDNQSHISAKNQETIRNYIKKGIEIVISTGRPYVGLPIDLLTDFGIRYAITANGAAIYSLKHDDTVVKRL